MATYVSEGQSIDYTPGSNVTAGQVVVLGELVGVAKSPITANTPGSLSVAGVFDFPKTTGGGTAITAGANVYWDVGDQVAKTDSETGANKLLGKAVRAAADGDATVRIRMQQ